MKRWNSKFLFILFIGLIYSNANADHIQYVSLADVSNVEIGVNDTWTHTFDLLNDDMYLWKLTSPTSTFGPTPDVSTAEFTGSYDPQDILHYVTLRIDPCNKWGSSTSDYISLKVNGIEFSDWCNPIRLYQWKELNPDPYGIAANDYKISVLLTGLSSLSSRTIPVDNVNIEGCFDSVTAVPEPASILLVTSGLVTCAGLKRKSKQK